MHALGDVGDLEGLIERATALATSWSASASGVTTVGQERAILRLFGVGGVDREGRPLAAEVVERHIGRDPTRLGAGIALPFAMAMAEYDLPPQDLALEVAAGNVELALEAELLSESDRRAVAVEDATKLARAALDRIDANRTARRELLALLGDPPRPRLGASLVERSIVDAIDEAGEAIAAGAEVLRVEVPPGRELADRLAKAGTPMDPWRPSPGSRGGLEAHDPSGAPVPTGSQRALRVLRAYVDQVAAERRGYVRLATETQVLSAPEQAVVAAFERIDLVIADPLREIVAGRVDPDRSIADHVFAHRLLARAGAQVLIPSGPLVVGADLATGMPSDAATRAGRALALQLLAVALARADRLPTGRVLIGALPEWLVDEEAAAARAVAEVALRRALLPDHPLAFVEPSLREDASLTWHAIMAAVLPDAGRVDLVLRRPGPEFAQLARQTRAAAAVAASLAGARRPPELGGAALEHAAGAVAAATRTLDGLHDRGWRSIVDEPLGLEGVRLGADAVAERTEAFDALAELEVAAER